MSFGKHDPPEKGHFVKNVENGHGYVENGNGVCRKSQRESLPRATTGYGFGILGLLLYKIDCVAVGNLRTNKTTSIWNYVRDPIQIDNLLGNRRLFVHDVC